MVAMVISELKSVYHVYRLKIFREPDHRWF